MAWALGPKTSRLGDEAPRLESTVAGEIDVSDFTKMLCFFTVVRRDWNAARRQNVTTFSYLVPYT